MRISLIIFGLLVAQSARAGVFALHDGFTATYPKGWAQLRSSVDGATDKHKLDLLSFPNSRRSEGVIIFDGGAEIILFQTSSQSETGDRDDIEITHEDLGTVGKCRNTHLVKWRTELGPNTYENDLDIRCEIGQKYTMYVRYFEKDPKEFEYRRVALEILKSLRETENRLSTTHK